MTLTVPKLRAWNHGANEFPLRIEEGLTESHLRQLVIAAAGYDCAHKAFKHVGLTELAEPTRITLLQKLLSIFSLGMFFFVF